MTIKRNALGHWLPGVSGNAGGRQRSLPQNVRELARSGTVEAIQTLMEIMRNPKEPATSRVSAAAHLLDRGWGKPEQAITGADGESLVIQVVRFGEMAIEAESKLIEDEAMH